MTEIKVNVEKVYTICGLTPPDIELICIGLDEVNDDEFVVRRDRIMAAIEAVL